jgi:hypothetical protein
MYNLFLLHAKSLSGFPIVPKTFHAVAQRPQGKSFVSIISVSVAKKITT